MKTPDKMKDPPGCYARKKLNRAGKRRCRRCTAVFNLVKGDKTILCERCRVHCCRCDIELTEDTKDKSASKRNQYYCKKCVAEVVRLTRDKMKQRDYDLLRKYGITVLEYEAILVSQNGVCWICQKSPTGNRLAVDHKHEVGEKKRNPREIRPRVRGLLCWDCNRALGKFRDNPSALRKAADYLEIWPAQKILTPDKEDGDV